MFAHAGDFSKYGYGIEISFPDKYTNEQNGVTFETVIDVPENLDYSKIKTGAAKLQYPIPE